jgi:hypothetical protein
VSISAKVCVNEVYTGNSWFFRIKNFLYVTVQERMLGDDDVHKNWVAQIGPFQLSTIL